MHKTEVLKWKFQITLHSTYRYITTALPNLTDYTYGAEEDSRIFHAQELYLFLNNLVLSFIIFLLLSFRFFVVIFHNIFLFNFFIFFFV